MLVGITIVVCILIAIAVVIRSTRIVRGDNPDQFQEFIDMKSKVINHIEIGRK